MTTDLTILEISLLVINIILFLGSKKLFNFFYQDKIESARPRIKATLLLTGSALILQIIHILIKLNVVNIEKNINEIILKLALSIIVLYSALIIQASVHYLLKKRHGEIDKIDGKEVVTDTHISRMWTIIMNFIIIFAVIYINIQIWSAASLMETTGIVGLTLGAMALTNGVWFPDIFRGVMSLKINSFKIGEVIKLDETETVYIVNGTSLFHITLLNINDNHRVYMWNHLLGNSSIHNLSRPAGSAGLRKTITYKIGYPEQVKENKEEIVELIEKIRKMALEAYEKSIEDKLHIKEKEFIINVKETGDYAIEFIMSYHLEHLPKTASPEKIRDYLINTPMRINEIFLIMSYKYGVDLSTPKIYKKI